MGTAGTRPVNLIVYDTWTFATVAEIGDFEYLWDMLLPADDVRQVGVRRVDVTDPGIHVAWTTRRRSDGARRRAGRPRPRRPAPAARHRRVHHRRRAAAQVDRHSGAGDPDGHGYDPLVDDPVVGLPFHGSWPATAAACRALWADTVDLRTDRRAAAGLGAGTSAARRSRSSRRRGTRPVACGRRPTS